jgi:N-acetylglutamate synthase-like GNAT family acetyltransferase
MNNPVLLTTRLKTILLRAEDYAGKNPVNSMHLLLASLQEKTGALGEISLHLTIDVSLLKSIAVQRANESSQTLVESPYFQKLVTSEVFTVMEAAKQVMERYNQVYINEGHFLKALLASSEIKGHLSEENQQRISALATTSRDMITYLGNYMFPEIGSFQIRRINMEDKHPLISFVQTHFSQEWSKTILSAFEKNKDTIYIAFNDQEELIGFAAYDVYLDKKNYFGPMGVSRSNRIRGVGYTLLHHCLRDMKEIGYEYAIIGGAGPIEFYEKACRAVVIPKMN